MLNPLSYANVNQVHVSTNHREERKSAGRVLGLSFLQNLITFSGCSPSPVVELTMITVLASSRLQVLPTSPRHAREI